MAMKLLETVSLSVATSPITISNIPANGKDLLVYISARSVSSTNAFNLQINGGVVNFTGRRLISTGGAISSSTNSNNIYISTINDATLASANVYSSVFMYFFNYATAKNQEIMVDTVTENASSSTNVESRLIASRRAVAAATNSLTFTPEAGNFGTNTLLQIYQIS